MEALLQLKDLKGTEDEMRRKEVEERIDEILDSDIDFPEEMEMDTGDTLAASVDQYALTVFGGYVTRKVRKMAPTKDCSDCQEFLLEVGAHQEREALLEIRSRGGLLRPSQMLFDSFQKVFSSSYS